MEPGVPFALLGAVQVLLVVATVGLAAAAALRRSPPGALVALGALLLTAVEVRTALRLGFGSSDDMALLRAAASLVVAAGLYSGGLGPRKVPTSTFGVVLPLGAAGGPAAFVATASALAGIGMLANRRDAVGAWIAGGFGFWAVAAGLTWQAGESAGAAQAVAALRGAGALSVLLGLLVLAQVSLLSKVVSAILAGVVTMALAAVGVVGNVVVDSYDRQTRDSVHDAGVARIQALDQLGSQVEKQAYAATLVCARAAGACPGFLRLFGTGGSDFLVRVRANGTTELGDASVPLAASTRLGLSSLPVVQTVLKGKGKDRADLVSDNVRLAGAESGVAVVGVAAGPQSRATGQDAPDEVWVYGVRIDSGYARLDLDLAGGFNFSLLTGDPLRVTASNLSANAQQRLLTQVSASDLLRAGLTRDGITIGSQGANPTVAVLPVQGRDGSTVGMLAMTRDPGPALRTERDALRLLLVTSLLALFAVAVAAVLLGRRTVDPVRRLTAAAERVAAGDLSTSVGVTTRDEVGTLSNTFDAMTSSLARLTGDLRASASRLGTVLSSMTDGLLATDGDGVVTSVNPAALAMLGLDEADVLGEPLVLVADVRSEAGESLVRLDAALLEEPGVVHRPDASELPVRVALLPLEGADGVVLVLRDTTREREVERMKTEFLSNVSHELRTPLTPIRGYAEILVGKPGLSAERVTTFATTIRDEALKMNRVVDLLVDVAAIEAGRVHVTPRDVPVRELLDARLAAWQTRAPARAKDLKRRVAAKLPPVHVDPVWVGKALDELLDNAVKYTPAGTTITLVAALSPDGGRVRVSVKDSGPGISEADRHRLFTSFEQVDGSATRKVGGLGLGLSFVRRLSEDAGFPLSVHSAPGKGAEFALDLPVA
jgi:PAS domain S-box-containing protein